MNKSEIKPFGYDWGECPKCETVGVRKGYMSVNVLNVFCQGCTVMRGREHPADYDPAPPAWEPKVGERVVDTKRNKPGFISEIHTTDECGDKWDFDVKHDDGTENSFLVTWRWIRPETRADREKRAREIVENAKPGDRFRVIEKPVELSGAPVPTYFNSHIRKGGIIEAGERPADSDTRMLSLDKSNTIEAWNLVPLPAEPEQYPCAKCGKLCSRPRSVTPFTICDECRSEPEKQRWEYVDHRIPKVGDFYVAHTPDYQIIKCVTAGEEDDHNRVLHRTILRPLPPDAEVADLKSKLAHREKGLARLAERCKNQRRELAQRNAEHEAMRAFFDAAAPLGPASLRAIGECYRGDTHEALLRMTFQWQRVLDAREARK